MGTSFGSRAVDVEAVEDLFPEKEDGIHGPHEGCRWGVSCLRLRGKLHQVGIASNYTFLGFEIMICVTTSSCRYNDDDQLAALRNGAWCCTLRMIN
jgi:hypothetical protein